MADAIFEAIDAHSTVGEFKIALHYDDVSLLITSVDVLNVSGDVQHVTVGTHAFDIPTGTNTSLPLSGFNQHMVSTFRGSEPPVFIG